MSLKKEMKKTTLSDKIAESFIPQKYADTESEDETAPKLAEVDEDDFEYNNELSSFRKQNVKLLSDVNAKYRGKISSRSEFQDSEDDSGEEQRSSEEQSSGNDYSDLKKYKKLKEKCDDSAEEYSEDDSEVIYEDADEKEEISEEEDSFCESSGLSEEEEDDDDEADEDGGRNDNEDQTTILRESNQSIQKGFAVQNQLRMWENMLQVRMVSHKMLIKANSLPGPSNFNELCNDSTELSTLAQETKRNVEGLLDNMVKMQEMLLGRFPETTDLLKQSKKRKLQTAANDEPVKRFANIIQANYKSYQPYCNSVIQKWYDRTKVLTPGSSSKRGNANGSDFDILQKIEAVLLNKSDLIKKSQTVKGNYKLFGRTAHDEVDVGGGDDDEGNTGFENTQNKKDDVSCPEIYDDLDFYDQQVRELIEFKTNTSNATETIKQFAALQQIRQKMKKKVDTRASKGRKIRYIVHKPLANFDASDPHSNWNNGTENELLSNLFKKIV